MPHVIIKMHSGRDEEIKQRCAKAVAKAIEESLPVDVSRISVSIEEFAPSEWKEKVYGPDIIEKNKDLYIKPGY